MALKEAESDPILQRLDTIIRLQARIAVSAIKEQRDRVVFLNEVGMGPQAISEMLGITRDSAASILKRARKVKSSKGAGETE
jgi:DNA-directed RNA polymerase specialized sigma24 family protein